MARPQLDLDPERQAEARPLFDILQESTRDDLWRIAQLMASKDDRHLVIALIGRLRHAEHRSVPEIHAELVRRGVPICARSVANLLDRYDELLALSLLRRRAGCGGSPPRPGG